jgi:hypothetical protein
LSGETRSRAVLLAVATAAVIAGGLLALLLLGTRAQGDEPQAPSSAAEAADPAEQRAREALVREARSLLAYDPERLGFEVVAAPPQPGIRAQIDLAEETITAFVASDEAPHLVAHDIAHELGHGLDRRDLDDADRDAYLERRGAAGAAWWPAEEEPDYGTGAGDFAEVYAMCTAPSPEFRSTLAGPPDDACSLLPAAVLAERIGPS